MKKYTILKLLNNKWTPLFRALPQSHIEAESDQEALRLWNERVNQRSAQLLLVHHDPILTIVDDKNLPVSRVELATRLVTIHPGLAMELYQNLFTVPVIAPCKDALIASLAKHYYPQKLLSSLYESQVLV